MSNNGEEQLQHIVYVMMENRGFDHVLGWLYKGENDVPSTYTPNTDNGGVQFYGLASAHP